MHITVRVEMSSNATQGSKHRVADLSLHTLLHIVLQKNSAHYTIAHCALILLPTYKNVPTNNAPTAIHSFLNHSKSQFSKFETNFFRTLPLFNTVSSSICLHPWPSTLTMVVYNDLCQFDHHDEAWRPSTETGCEK